MVGQVGALALALLVLGPRLTLAGDLDSPGCMAGGTPAAVASVDEMLDLHLVDGRTVRLPGIAVPSGAAEARQNLAAWLTHTAVTVAPLRAAPDRWGRTVALVFAAPPGGPGRLVSVGEALIESGGALARPDPQVEVCWATELRLEREAERQEHGLWATTSVLTPSDTAGLQARAGTFTIVDGRVAAVHEGRARLYLRFAGTAGSGMAAALALPFVRRLAKGGTDPRNWQGRRLRVRGLLDDRWGWQIEVTTPQQLEFDIP